MKGEREARSQNLEFRTQDAELSPGTPGGKMFRSRHKSHESHRTYGSHGVLTLPVCRRYRRYRR